MACINILKSRRVKSPAFLWNNYNYQQLDFLEYFFF